MGMFDFFISVKSFVQKTTIGFQKSFGKFVRSVKKPILNH